jgi:hypothetical protein
VKWEGRKKEMFLLLLLENVGFPFDHQAKMQPANGATKGHV